MKAPVKEIDKSTWGPGPWQEEPDRVEFEVDGFPCLIVRVRDTGHLCGYVAVAPGHPWHGVDMSSYPSDIEHPDVHGGITYSDKCSGRICHVPKPGTPDDVWWLGFDCAHSGDLMPSMNAYRAQRGLPTLRGEAYRTIGYVKGECEALARQAKEAIKPAAQS